MTPSRSLPASVADHTTVLAIVSDRQRRDRLESSLTDRRFAVRTAASGTPLPTDLEDVDCLVSEYPTATDDFLERVRQRRPDLPVVLLVDAAASPTAALETIRAHQWVDYIHHHEPATPVTHLEHRIQTLLERQRFEALSQRSLASIELAKDAIAIIGPDGDIEVTNRSFAVQFCVDQDELPGTPWQALFTDESVERLETAAIPTVTDGWRWTGNCTGRRPTGETVPVRIRLGSLEDGSLVFVVDTA